MKTCKTCKLKKELREFHKRVALRGGYRHTCKKCFNTASKSWYKDNREKHLNNGKIWYAQNTKQRLQTIKIYYKNNKEKYKIRSALKLKRIKQSTPLWANLEKIKAIYLDRPNGYHVDHIIPLKGLNVCGLHVENNLQYLTAKENKQKSNKLLEEYM